MALALACVAALRTTSVKAETDSSKILDVEDLSESAMSATHELNIPSDGEYVIAFSSDNCMNMSITGIENEKVFEKFKIGGWHYAEEHAIEETVELKKGKYTLTLSMSYYGEMGGYSLTVYPLYRIESKTTKLSLTPGGKSQLKYEVIKNRESVKLKAKFKSSDSKVAKVSSTGKVVAVASGVCEITITVKSAVKVIKVVVVPEKVGAVKVMKNTKQQVVLQWKKVTGADGYVVEYYDPDFEEYVVLKTVKSGKTTKATFKSLDHGVKYTVRVKAYVKDGSSKKYGKASDTISFKCK